jgi:Ulp1 family protease
MALLPENMSFRRPELCASTSSAILLNSFFYDGLCDDNDFDAAKRRSANDDMFGANLAIIPINLGNTHWVLLTVDTCQCRFSFWDSMGSAGSQHVKLVQDFFQQLWTYRTDRRRLLQGPLDEKMPLSELTNLKTATTKKGTRERIELFGRLPAKAPKDWDVYAPMKASPQQQGSNDCGVFACQKAVDLVFGTRILENVDKGETTGLRNLMANELKNGKLLKRLNYKI